jgi:peptidoglycan/LPS O-acetylase OafA/YrhL
MLDERLTDVRLQKNFYRDYYRRFLKLLMVCFAVIIVLIVLIVLALLSRGEPDYYATSDEGMVQRIYYAPWGSHLITPDQDRQPVQRKAPVTL